VWERRVISFSFFRAKQQSSLRRSGIHIGQTKAIQPTAYTNEFEASRILIREALAMACGAWTYVKPRGEGVHGMLRKEKSTCGDASKRW